VDATGIPAPAYSLSVAPYGMIINSASGVIDWTPDANQLGLNAVTVTAANGQDPNATQSFDVDVAGEAPVITSTPVTTATVNQPYSYDVNATGIPEPTYSLTVAPSGMTINSTSGLIDWTPDETQLGLNPVTVIAANGKEPNDTQSFEIDVAIILRDDFNDNRRGAMWRLYFENYDNMRLSEDANRLNITGEGEIDLLSSCVGHWKMNDNDANTTVLDSSGNGNDGTTSVQDTCDLHTDSGNPPYLNGALTFDGSGDYIDLGKIIGTDSYTKVAWVKRADGQYVNNIVSADTASHAFFAPKDTGFKLAAGHNGNWTKVKDTVALAPNMWYFVAVTFELHVSDPNFGTMVLYRDGNEVNRNTDVQRQYDSDHTYIGRFYTGYYWAGEIDNVMIFDRALTAEEISLLYNSGNGTEDIPDGIAETTVADYTANGWSLKATEDFAIKADFHYSDVSVGDGWAGITVADNNSYVSISAGSDSNDSYFYYEALVDGNVVSEKESRSADDGTLYISYDAAANEMYLSHVDYGSTDAYTWSTIPSPLQGQWTSASVEVGVGGGCGVALASGEAYLDNVIIDDSKLLGWPPVTDLDGDGYIDLSDLEIIAYNWLDTDAGTEGGDINDNGDSDGTVNFRDFAELGLAW
jgi:hypothetical protein